MTKLQNLAWTSDFEHFGQDFEVEQKKSFLTKPQLRNLQQTVANTILDINISNNIKKFWVGIFTRQGYINQVF